MCRHPSLIYCLHHTFHLLVSSSVVNLITAKSIDLIEMSSAHLKAYTKLG